MLNNVLLCYPHVQWFIINFNFEHVRYQDEETVIGSWNIPEKSIHGYTKVVRPLWKSETIQAWSHGSGMDERTLLLFGFVQLAARLERVVLLMAQIARVTSAEDDAMAKVRKGRIFSFEFVSGWIILERNEQMRRVRNACSFLLYWVLIILTFKKAKKRIETPLSRWR